VFSFVLVVCAIQNSLQSPLAQQQQQQQSDNLKSLDISCVINATCIKNVSNKLVKALNTHKSIDFGSFSIEPVKGAKSEGRSASNLWNIVNTNALRVPFGSYALNVQKSNEYDSYMEVAVAKVEGGSGENCQFSELIINICKTHRTRTRKKANAILHSFIFGCQSSWMVDFGSCRRCIAFH